MKNRLILVMSVLSFCLLLGGCGEDQALKKFKKAMDEYCLEIAEIDNGINSIDTQSETRIEDLMNYLDQLDSAFKKLADMTVPEEFNYIEELADDASEYMTEAVSLYHEAYSNNSFNEYTAAYAREYYERACKRLNYIITFLHGDIPEGDDITILQDGDTDTGETDDAGSSEPNTGADE